MSGMGAVTPCHRRMLTALAIAAKEQSHQRGMLDDIMYDAFVALMGEGCVVPRHTRSWAKPEWCASQCPGCSRVLRLLVVPTLDVVQCIYCETSLYVCRTHTPMAGLGLVRSCSKAGSSGAACTEHASDAVDGGDLNRGGNLYAAPP